MSIQKWYEIICDNCGNACYHSLAKSISVAEIEFESVKGIVAKDKKHFCDKDCQEEYEKNH